MEQKVILLYSNKAKTILSKCALIIKSMYLIQNVYLYSCRENIKKPNLDRTGKPYPMLIGYTANKQVSTNAHDYQ